MLYRKFGRTGVDVSILGFGLMRLPLATSDENDPDRNKKIDEAEATRMVHKAIDSGVNYFDTAYVYHGEMSESFTGKALSGGKRNKVCVATKSPVWRAKETGDFAKYLDTQLERLQTDYIDFYLLHALSIGTFNKIVELDVFNEMEKFRKAGKIRFLGFSFHDDQENFFKIYDSYKFDFCQIQYNFLDEEFQAGRAGMLHAAKDNTAIIAMEPLRGGDFTKKVPKPVQDIWDSMPQKRTPAQWALRWVWNHPQFSLLLSGMTTMEQLEENIQTASKAQANSLTAQELENIGKVKDTYNSLIAVPCTKCQYCMPCPSGVAIPDNFSFYNDYRMFGDGDGPKFAYNNFFPEHVRADKCTECGECEEKCPQQIPIREKLKEVHQNLAK
jgi:predicted aldo/keto reductase-like oxidoreductase